MDWNILVPLTALKSQHFSTRTLQSQQDLDSEWTSVFSNSEAVCHKITAHIKAGMLPLVIFILSHSLKARNMLSWKSSLSRKKKEAETSSSHWFILDRNAGIPVSQPQLRDFCGKGRALQKATRKKGASELNLDGITTISNHGDWDKRKTTMKMKEYDQNKIWKSEEGKKRNKTQNQQTQNKTKYSTKQAQIKQNYWVDCRQNGNTRIREEENVFQIIPSISSLK